MGQDRATTQQARTADRRPGQELAVVGVEIALDAEESFDGVDLAGARPIVLVEVGVHVHTAVTNRVIQLPKTFQCLGGDRQGEPGDDRNVQQRGGDVIRVGGVPGLDLLTGEPQRVGFGGDQGAGGGRPHGLDAAPADDAQTPPPGFGEQRVLRVREGRTEHHRRSGARSDPSIAELGRDAPSEIRVREPGLGREDASLEPLQQLSAAVGVAGVGLWEVDVGVDESRHQEPGTMVADPRRGELRGHRVAFSAVGDPPVGDDERAVGYRHERDRRVGDDGLSGDVEHVPEMHLSHLSDDSAAGRVARFRATGCTPC